MGVHYSPTMHLCFRILLFLHPEVHVYFALFCPHLFLENSLKAAPWFSRAHHRLCLSHEGHPSAQSLGKARMAHGYCPTDAWTQAQRRERFAQGRLPVVEAGTVTPHVPVKSHSLGQTSLPKPKPQHQHRSVQHTTWAPRHTPPAAGKAVTWAKGGWARNAPHHGSSSPAARASGWSSFSHLA